LKDSEELREGVDIISCPNLWKNWSRFSKSCCWSRKTEFHI